MIGDINLIPQSEVIEQQKTKAVKTSTVASLVILALLVLVSAYILVVTGGIKKQIKSADDSISTLRGSINELSLIEISARNLDTKFKVLNNLFTQRPRYSALLEELKVRKPAEINIDSLDVKPEALNISGKADSYIAIAGFVNNLLNKSFEGGNEKLKELFTTVSLNSVSLEKSTNVVNFFIVVAFDENLLKQ